MRKTILFTILILALHWKFAWAQDDLAQYFDDNNISRAKNIIKLNLAPIVSGDLSLAYERAITPALGLELSFGRLLDMPSLDYFSEEKIVNLGTGYSFALHPKFYLSGKAPAGSHMGFMYRRRMYDSGLNHHDYTYNVGFQHIISGRFSFEYHAGIGVRRINNPNSQDIFDRKISVAMPVGLKFGILF